MKRTLLQQATAAALLTATASCNNSDSVEQAQQQNEARDDAATADTNMGDVEQEGMDFDTEFITHAASGGMLEVELGTAVAANAASREAKEFANQMVSDHSKANAGLKSLAAQQHHCTAHYPQRRPSEGAQRRD
ncbi:DUF4142 domain-containing protein [Hymenobacter rubripertinctus]|uniref:DUF4142 domain-containing protein n=1 Tax=Hymenobacter rubripertinctus TaxID=2029981 RepID=A0A418R261_9BACT|nr:DUF4142 domain-containing protein [Hymenobacter rubripertinctus]